MKEQRKEGRTEGRKEARTDGSKEARKEGRKEYFDTKEEGIKEYEGTYARVILGRLLNVSSKEPAISPFFFDKQWRKEGRKEGS